MEFVIKGMKYNTEKMEKVAEVKKWYLINSFVLRSIYQEKKLAGHIRGSYGNRQKEIGF